jgi:hypothetical protein
MVHLYRYLQHLVIDSPFFGKQIPDSLLLVWNMDISYVMVIGLLEASIYCAILDQLSVFCYLLVSVFSQYSSVIVC